MKRRLVTVLSIGALVASGTGVSAVARPAEPGAGDVALDAAVGVRDTLNLAADGLVPVTVFGTPQTDAADIDPATVSVRAGEGPGARAARYPDGAPIATTADVDDDGRTDLVVHVDAADLRAAGEVSAATSQVEVTATLADGLRATDSSAVRPEVRLEVKFQEGLRLRTDGSTMRSARGTNVQRVNDALADLGVETVAPLVEDVPVQQLEAMAGRSSQRSAAPAPDMAAWYTVTLRADVDVDAVLARLQAMPEVVHAYPAPLPAPPPQHVGASTAVVEPAADPVADVTQTPDFTDMQGYFGPAPDGIDAEFARQDPRTRGAGITVVDLEYDWHAPHEDLGLDWSSDLGGTLHPRYSYYGADHGTAVFGELVALENGFGVTGGVPDAEMYGIAPMTSRGGYSPAAALTYLANLTDRDGDPFLKAGDAVLLEQQSSGPINGAYAPITWIASTFDAVKLLSSKGIMMIEAGGNGGTSLDDPRYTRNGIAWFDRSVQDSGSILVGAGMSTSRNRMGFSSHGSRVDLQGWGQNITTTGYGNLWGGTDLDRQYSRSFSGTSGASPIVTSAVVALQSYAAATGQEPMTTDEIVEVLRETGTPQPAASAHEPIGPLPNLRAALKAVEVDVPTTTMTLNQKPATDGTYAGLVVFLSAEDGWGSGVDRIEYRIDGGAWRQYEGRFRVTGLGRHTLEYRAVDANGNTEDTHTFTFVSRTR